MFIDSGFDDIIDYKGIKIRRAKLSDGYYMIKASGEALTLNTMNEKNLDLLGLPYLTYINNKSKEDKDFFSYWQVLNWIFYVSIIDADVVLTEDSLTVYEKTESFDQYKAEYLECCDIVENFLDKDIGTQDMALSARKRITYLERIIYNKKSFSCKEFDEIRNIICQINGFDNTKYDPHWEGILKEAKSLKNSISDGEGLTLTDLVNTLAFYLKKFPNELRDLDYYTFNHYIKLMGDFEEYKLNRSAELQGTQFKQRLTHWFTHYKPVGKYDDVLSSGDVTKDLE